MCHEFELIIVTVSCGVNSAPTPRKSILIFISVSAVRPSVTVNKLGRYRTILSYKKLELVKLSVTKDGLTAETGLRIKKYSCGIGTLITLHLIIMNFHFIDEKKIIIFTFSQHK